MSSKIQLWVIVNKLHRKKVVGKWLVCGRYVVGMWLVCGRYVVGMWSVCGRYVVGMWSVVRWSVGGR